MGPWESASAPAARAGHWKGPHASRAAATLTALKGLAACSRPSTGRQSCPMDRLFAWPEQPRNPRLRARTRAALLGASWKQASVSASHAPGATDPGLRCLSRIPIIRRAVTAQPAAAGALAPPGLASTPKCLRWLAQPELRRQRAVGVATCSPQARSRRPARKKPAASSRRRRPGVPRSSCTSRHSRRRRRRLR